MSLLLQNVRGKGNNRGPALLAEGLRLRVDYKEAFRIRDLAGGQLCGCGRSDHLGKILNIPWAT